MSSKRLSEPRPANRVRVQSLRLRLIELAALQLERSFGSLAQGREILRFDETKITLGRHMQGDGVTHGLGKRASSARAPTAS